MWNPRTLQYLDCPWAYDHSSGYTCIACLTRRIRELEAVIAPFASYLPLFEDSEIGQLKAKSIILYFDQVRAAAEAMKGKIDQD